MKTKLNTQPHSIISEAQYQASIRDWYLTLQKYQTVQIWLSRQPRAFFGVTGRNTVYSNLFTERVRRPCMDPITVLDIIRHQKFGCF